MSESYRTILSEEIYTSTLSEEDIQLSAEEQILKHGDNAFAEAEKEIRALIARGEFSLAESWLLVCQRVRKLQALDHNTALGSVVSD